MNRPADHPFPLTPTRQGTPILFLGILLLGLTSCGESGEGPNPDGGPGPEVLPGSRLAITRVETDLLDQFARASIPGAGEKPSTTWSRGKVSVAKAHPKSPPRAGEMFVNIKKMAVKKGGNRPCLIAPPPSEVRFLQEIPNKGSLQFGVGLGLKTLANIEHPVRFRITADGEEVFLHTFSDVLRGKEKPDWEDQTVDLSRFGGRTVELSLETSALGNPETSDPLLLGWSQPVLTELEEVPIQRSSKRAPNIIVVLVDTLRADHLGCYGYPRPTTPNVDAWAKTAFRFDRAIAPSPWTWPSTATLLTGLHPHTHGVIKAEQCFLSERIRSAAEYFQDQGFRTFGVSANPLICNAQNFDQGFEELVEVFHEPAEVVNRHAFSFLRERGEERFFLYLHYMDPHYPYAPPDEDLAPFKETRTSEDDNALYREIAAAPNQIKIQTYTEQVQHLTDLYDGEIRHFDRHFAELLRTLREIGAADKTILLFTSDHGEELFDHGRVGHARTLYDEVLHVPLLVSGLPELGTGSCPTVVPCIDTLPTLLGLAGLDPEGDGSIQGRPLPLPGTSRSKGAISCYSTTEMGHPDGAGFYLTQAAVTTDEWKLIYQPMTGKAELFRLTEDPREKTNLLETNRTVAEGLWGGLKTWMTESNQASVGTMREVSDLIKQRLVNLGYVDIPDPEAPEPDGPERAQGTREALQWDGKTFLPPR